MKPAQNVHHLSSKPKESNKKLSNLFQWHNLLYTSITAVATVQFIYLAAFYSNGLNQFFTHSASQLIKFSQSYFQPQTQLSFNHSLLSSTLYSATIHYRQFSKGFTNTAETGTYLLVITLSPAAKRMAHDFTEPISKVSKSIKKYQLAQTDSHRSRILGVQVSATSSVQEVSRSILNSLKLLIHDL